MKKEKTVRTYQRRTKSGKMVTVREHKASYDAAEAMREAAKKSGAGNELMTKKSKMDSGIPKLEFTADEFKIWANDLDDKEAARIDKVLVKKYGEKAVQKLADEINAGHSRTHKKVFERLSKEHNDHYTAQNERIASAAKDISRGAKDSSVDNRVQKAADAAGFKIKPKGNGKYLIQMGTGKWRTTTGEDIISQSEEEVSLHPSWKESKESKDSSKSKNEKSSSTYYGSMSDDDLYSAYKKHKDSEPKITSKKYKALDDKVMAVLEQGKEIGRKYGYDSKEYKANDKKFKKALDERDKWYGTPEGKKYREALWAHRKTSDDYSKEISRREESSNAATEKELKKLGLATSAFKYNKGTRGDGSLSAKYSTAWGRPDSSNVNKLIQKAKDAGWKKADSSSSMQPDDKGYRSTERYVSPDGKHELTYHYSAGDFSHNNHYVTIRRTKSEETPTKQTEPKAKKSISKI